MNKIVLIVLGLLLISTSLNICAIENYVSHTEQQNGVQQQQYVEQQTPTLPVTVNPEVLPIVTPSVIPTIPDLTTPLPNIQPQVSVTTLAPTTTSAPTDFDKLKSGMFDLVQNYVKKSLL